MQTKFFVLGITIAAMLAILVAASLTFGTGSAFAAPMPPEHVFILPIGDPCPQCPYPTPTKQAKPIESHAPLAKFTSRGHALGFRSNGVVVSNATYALNIEFVGMNHNLGGLKVTAQLTEYVWGNHNLGGVKVKPR